MFCAKCGMPSSICICNIMPIVAPAGEPVKKVKQVVVYFEDDTKATFKPGVAEPTIDKDRSN